VKDALFHLLSQWLLRSTERRKKLWKQLKPEFETKPSLGDAMRQKYPQLAFASPGHFYSPLPDISEALAYREGLSAGSELASIDMRVEQQIQLCEQLTPYFESFDWPQAQTPERRYYSANDQFLTGDAAMLAAMIQHYRPRRIVEVGSGFSSAIMLDLSERSQLAETHLTFVEPYPDRLRKLLRNADAQRCKLIEAKVQDCGQEVFSQLSAGDFLFIDSSHVSKAGSDLNHLMFEVIPRLAPGVIVHFHDMFWPFEYPASWIKEGRAWNELYLVRAFLAHNSAWQVMAFGSFLGVHCQERVPPAMAKQGFGGYLWLQKRSD
jgi:predicted O-methyltransferase YrrM